MIKRFLRLRSMIGMRIEEKSCDQDSGMLLEARGYRDETTSSWRDEGCLMPYMAIIEK